MGKLKYKGYTGSVEYSEEDNCLFGKVQGLTKDCITYEGNNVDELRHDFEEAVDCYLASCEQRGEPTVAELIETSLAENEMTQKQLAIMIGVSPSRINDYVSGRAEPTLKIARQLCHTLHISPAAMLSY